MKTIMALHIECRVARAQNTSQARNTVTLRANAIALPAKMH